jgi:hypothetical protein
MGAVARVLGVMTLLASLTACSFESHHEGDVVSHRVGSDYFGAGGSVNLTEAVPGDAFLAGGHVSTASQIQGDLVAAGGDVSVGGAVDDDLYAAGGEVRLDAIVSGNARIAGGAVTVGPATVVTGAVTLNGGNVRFEGRTQEYLQANGGEVHIDGTVQGDAEVHAERVEIGPTARIGGRLVVRAEHEPVVAQGAEIAGGVDYEPVDINVRFDDGHRGHDFSVGHGIGSFLWILGVFVAGVLFTLAFPAYSARAADWIGREPLRSLGLGFVVLVCLPILGVLLLVTIVGIPLALILFMLYVLLLFLGWVTAALFVGRKGLELVRSAQPVTTAWRVGALLAAVIALWLVGQVPLVGGWVTFAALVLGIGALVWQGWPRRNDPPAVSTGAS